MKIQNLAQLMTAAKEKEKKKIAVVAAEDLDTLIVVERALEEHLAEFILIGDELAIKSIIEAHKMQIKAEIYHELDHKKAADLAVDLVVNGKAGALMKGLIHSNVFLKAILNKEKSLNTGRHITQISITENLENDGLLMITDCAISVAPDTMGKKEIIENAVALAHQLGIEIPKVGILASVENINLTMQDTIDAAVLSKMSERGQIKGCIVDGPFAFDNVISKEAAAHKGINSPVAGVADIVLVPNLLVGNVLTKSLTYMAKKQVVAATVGAAVPIVFTSRTESIDGKLLSIALATYTA
ncbi:bifunctional enoyl-CoA hydratase/phosphate acetyltransferase [Fusibacter ferrireducens]|uniref:Bifunctional enoyl-CoA hydratase/phosphate acetyltransferase n=1 Tax=Fusibacter ferrireducens TaxID=2785058 RepID=A0ABR9ZWC9_9FIRM|nr:bifunctional enoyl-CoA hydratase/phosphate acetyltransferase [Fusibacter ferrireducens]MBF4694748.1 bifunctional enoyl-CoA hydratase/phosphate acetyltransferase [Fusibacter ferrireducens]